MNKIDSFKPFVRELSHGMGTAVGERTILRKKSSGAWENWGDVANRVALGNSLLCPNKEDMKEEYKSLYHHISKATLLMSGRHLQHGDETQPQRTEEVYTNCLDGSTSILTVEYGPTAIENVAGQTVTVIAGDGVPRPAFIHEHGKQEIFEIIFRAVKGGGEKLRHVVRATADHRWQLRNGTITEHLYVDDVIAALPNISTNDSSSIVHGLVFGDGSAHKSHNDSYPPGVSQGRTYASIRVCKQDSVKDEIVRILIEAGYKATYPKSADGDPVFYIGKFEHIKDVPYCNDPDYIAGFIHGWWLADGSKTLNGEALEISTSNHVAAEWLITHASYAGYSVTQHRIMERKDGDGSFANGKPLHVIRIRRNCEFKVESITCIGEASVYCPEEPVTGLFVLTNGLLTGNCSTAATSFAKFLLLLSGSGVGRCYDDDMMLIDWDNAPNLRCVLSHQHPDFDWSAHESVRDAEHKYGHGRNVIWHKVADSREGWAKALEIWEVMAFEKIHREKSLILDFSDVRCSGSLIAGMQNRPASGPVALMNAFTKAASLKGCSLDPWRQTIYIDHYFSECVLVGGARRSARLSSKDWRNPSIFEFITVKRPIEFIGKSVEEIINIRNECANNKINPPLSFLWSSNNSIMVDREFWSLLEIKRGDDGFDEPLAKHARRVFKLATEAAYADGTGEPGFINVDKLTRNDSGWEELTKGNWFGSSKYQVEEDTQLLLSRLAKKARKKQYYFTTNPCGEIILSILSGFCTIGDCVPYHADTLDEAEDAFRAATRALIRVNLMDSIYQKEVERTNRIGVGITGVHEFAWKFFRCGFRDLINPDFVQYHQSDINIAAMKDYPHQYSSGLRSAAFWMTLARFNRAVREESISYSRQLGVVTPHTCTTIKPSGSVSKLFSLTEGWHLPPLAFMLRWVQFRHDDPLIEQYKVAGYPWRELTQYSGTVIIGFPTAPAIANLGMGDALVLAGEATPEEQYKWLMLGEKYWINGVDVHGDDVKESYGNQISYTLKINPDVVDYKHFRDMLTRYQSKIKCCSVMPQVNNVAYEYLPEEAISRGQFEEIFKHINNLLAEDVGKEHIDCLSGGCPIDFNSGDKTIIGEAAD